MYDGRGGDSSTTHRGGSDRYPGCSRLDVSCSSFARGARRIHIIYIYSVGAVLLLLCRRTYLLYRTPNATPARLAPWGATIRLIERHTKGHVEQCITAVVLLYCCTTCCTICTAPYCCLYSRGRGPRDHLQARTSCWHRIYIFVLSQNGRDCCTECICIYISYVVYSTLCDPGWYA